MVKVKNLIKILVLILFSSFSLQAMEMGRRSGLAHTYFSGTQSSTRGTQRVRPGRGLRNSYGVSSSSSSSHSHDEKKLSDEEQLLIKNVYTIFQQDGVTLLNEVNTKPKLFIFMRKHREILRNTEPEEEDGKLYESIQKKAELASLLSKKYALVCNHLKDLESGASLAKESLIADSLLSNLGRLKEGNQNLKTYLNTCNNWVGRELGLTDYERFVVKVWFRWASIMEDLRTGFNEQLSGDVLQSFNNKETVVERYASYKEKIKESEDKNGIDAKDIGLKLGAEYSVMFYEILKSKKEEVIKYLTCLNAFLTDEEKKRVKLFYAIGKVHNITNQAQLNGREKFALEEVEEFDIANMEQFNLFRKILRDYLSVMQNANKKVLAAEYLISLNNDLLPEEQEAIEHCFFGLRHIPEDQNGNFGRSTNPTDDEMRKLDQIIKEMKISQKNYRLCTQLTTNEKKRKAFEDYRKKILNKSSCEDENISLENDKERFDQNFLLMSAEEKQDVVVEHVQAKKVKVQTLSLQPTNAKVLVNKRMVDDLDEKMDQLKTEMQRSVKVKQLEDVVRKAVTKIKKVKTKLEIGLPSKKTIGFKSLTPQEVRFGKKYNFYDLFGTTIQEFILKNSKKLGAVPFDVAVLAHSVLSHDDKREAYNDLLKKMNELTDREKGIIINWFNSCVTEPLRIRSAFKNGKLHQLAANKNFILDTVPYELERLKYELKKLKSENLFEIEKTKILISFYTILQKKSKQVFKYLDFLNWHSKSCLNIKKKVSVEKQKQKSEDSMSEDSSRSKEKLKRQKQRELEKAIRLSLALQQRAKERKNQVERSNPEEVLDIKEDNSSDASDATTESSKSKDMSQESEDDDSSSEDVLAYLASLKSNAEKKRLHSELNGSSDENEEVSKDSGSDREIDYKVSPEKRLRKY